jgi:CRP/FNR family cyclic AMP-dependent transcriptional regulator
MSITSFAPDQIDAHQLLVEVAAGRSTATYVRGERIYSQGQAADVVFFIQAGRVQITLRDNGADEVIGTAGEGQFFGGTCLYDVKVRVASATALLECRITSITKEAILSAIAQRPRFAKMFTDHLWYNETAPQKEMVARLVKLAERAH